MNMISITLSLLALIICHEASAGRRSGPVPAPMSFDNMQTLMPGFEMEWTSSDEDITFKLRVKTTGWVGLGISPMRNPEGMGGADIVICGAMPDGSNYIFDTIATGNTIPRLDQSQGVQLLSATEVNGLTTVVFRRKLVGDGIDDVDITKGNVGIIYAFGSGPDPLTINQVTYHGRNRGKTSLVLLPPTTMPPTTSKEMTTTTTTTAMEDTTMPMPAEPQPSPETSGGEQSATGNENEETTGFDLNSLDLVRREASPSGKMILIIRIKDGNITFELTATTQGWIGIGFSDEAGMNGADLIMGGYGKNGPYLFDTHAIGNSAPIVDESQDVQLLSGMQNDTHTTIIFTRKLLATDENDKSVMRGKPLHFLYAVGCYDLVDGPHAVNYHFLNRGSFETDLTLSKDQDTDTEEDGGVMEDRETEFDGFSSGQQYLDDGRTVQLSWWNNENGTITIQVSAPTQGWVGFGINPRKNMVRADIIMSGVANGGNGYILDAFSTRNGPPRRDAQQDVELIAYSQNGTHTSVTFQRKYRTGDTKSRRDLVIKDGPMSIIWAFGPQDVRSGKPQTGGYHGRANRGSATVQLVSPELRASLYPKTGKVILNKKSDVRLQWLADTKNIKFQLGALTKGWVGLGISPRPNMRQADMAMLGVRNNGMSYAFDVFSTTNGVPSVDKSQDVTLLASREVDGRTIVLLQRPLRAVEKKFDRKINEGKVNLIWAFGQTDVDIRPVGLNYHGREDRGSMKVELIPRMDENPVLERF